jgi:predicted dehydrogenase
MKDESRSHRRQFLKTAALSAVSSVAGPVIMAQAKGERRYRTALIGTGWWGMNILGEAMRAGRSTIVALCDVDQRLVNPARDRVEKETGSKPNIYSDFRELLEREKPEIVIVATPDHWHPLITIAALRSGAHVYVEKPVGHTIGEGRAMVTAARETKGVVQVGTHRRVSPHNVSGMEFLRSGKAGRIGSVRAFVHYEGGAEKPILNQQPPPELDWEMWCGPAPKRYYCENKGDWGNAIHRRSWRSYLDYANGTLGDWGIHWMDQILWWSEEKYPKTVTAAGGRPIKGVPVYNEKEQTTDAPDHLVATFEFEEFTAYWEHRNFAGHTAERGENVGCHFYGTKGTFHMGWKDGWSFYPAQKGGKVITQKPTLHEPDQQNIRELWTDLIDSIESKRRAVCDIEIGHLSTNVSLLGMLSYKLGRSVKWNGEKESFDDDEAANQLLRREYRGAWEYPS